MSNYENDLRRLIQSVLDAMDRQEAQRLRQALADEKYLYEDVQKAMDELEQAKRELVHRLIPLAPQPLGAPPASNHYLDQGRHWHEHIELEKDRMQMPNIIRDRRVA
jgi:hypothetical protein